MRALELACAAPLHASPAQSALPLVLLSGGGTIELRASFDGDALIVDATAGAAGIDFEPVAHFTGGGYPSAVVEFLRMNPSGNPVTLRAAKGESINGGAGIASNALHTRLRCYIESARIAGD